MKQLKGLIEMKERYQAIIQEKLKIIAQYQEMIHSIDQILEGPAIHEIYRS
jgi:hypothetical protein